LIGIEKAGLQPNQGEAMKAYVLFASVFVTTLAVPVAANAQGVPGGAAHGFYEGGRRAGPIGAVVGGAVGGVIGGVEGVLGINHRYESSFDGPPPPTYRHRRALRHKARHHRRVRHAAR
jgi:hypothetical protein